MLAKKRLLIKLLFQKCVGTKKFESKQIFVKKILSKKCWFDINFLLDLKKDGPKVVGPKNLSSKIF